MKKPPTQIFRFASCLCLVGAFLGLATPTVAFAMGCSPQTAFPGCFGDSYRDCGVYAAESIADNLFEWVSYPPSVTYQGVSSSVQVPPPELMDLSAIECPGGNSCYDCMVREICDGSEDCDETLIRQHPVVQLSIEQTCFGREAPPRPMVTVTGEVVYLNEDGTYQDYTIINATENRWIYDKLVISSGIVDLCIVRVENHLGEVGIYNCGGADSNLGPEVMVSTGVIVKMNSLPGCEGPLTWGDYEGVFADVTIDQIVTGEASRAVNTDGTLGCVYQLGGGVTLDTGVLNPIPAASAGATTYYCVSCPGYRSPPHLRN